MTSYDEIEALNWSTLKHIDVNPKYAKNLYDHPEEQEDKDAYIAGRAIHCAILEPDEFDSRYEIMPTFKGTGSVAAKKEYLSELPAGVEAIKQDVYDMAIRCTDAISDNKNAQQYISGGKYEQIVTWTTDGIKCKGRLDSVTDRVVDLKTTRHNTIRKIENSAAEYNYHAQLAWYHDGAVKAGLITGEVLPAVIFIHATKKSEYVDIAILDMGQVSRTFEYGRAKYQNLLEKYTACHSANWWPGMAPNPVMWDLPQWKLIADEEN